jgi:hypothetical protein
MQTSRAGAVRRRRTRLPSCCWRPIHVAPVGVFKSDSHFRFCVRSWSLAIVWGRSWSAWLWPGDERLNFDDGAGFAVQGRAVQEPQQVLGESLRVQDVGDVLLSGQYQLLYLG